MNEQEPQLAPRKQRALNALVFLLAVAVCVQGYMLWETHERVNSMVAQLDRVKTKVDTAGWDVIPRSEPDANAQAKAQYPDPQTLNSMQQSLDPLAQLDPSTDPSGMDPFADMDRIRKEMDRMMQSMAPQVRSGPPAIRTEQRPTTLSDRGDAYVVTASLPDSDASGISLQIKNQSLYITARHDRTIQNQQKHERVTGSSQQRVPLGEPIDAKGMKYTFKDGVLTVTIPKLNPGSSNGANSEPSESVRN